MVSGTTQRILTEDEYWRMFDSVRGDVEAAIKSNYAYFTIHRLAAADRKILDKYQRAAHFWTLNTYALQTTFFIAFGRIFDERKDCFSIQKLVKATIANPALFSKTALRARRRKNDNMTKPDPAWLVDYVNQAWEPTTADLKPLLAALMPHQAKFKSIYQPIRHTYFAHRGMASQKAIETLFSRTLKADVVEILKFLHTVLWAIRDMAWNARKPDLNNFADYGAYVKGLNKQIEEFIRKLP
jgi:hypothetical protein